ncbi:MAG: hypothetical protein U1E54_03335 [Candidatus Levybacteria bacterium]|nr:hypothetical protein [Candidatus Levybacteria bacterium]
MTTIISKDKGSDYMKAQIAEMLSPLNRYFAGTVLGHPPSKEEAVMHYITHGGSADFEKRWKYQHEDAGA